MSRNESLLTEINKKIDIVSKKLANKFKSKMLGEVKKNKKISLEKINSFLDTAINMNTGKGKKINETMVRTEMKNQKSVTKLETKIHEVIKERDRAIRKYENKALGNVFNEVIVDAHNVYGFDHDRVSLKYDKEYMITHVSSILKNMIVSKLRNLNDSQFGLYGIVTIKYAVSDVMSDDYNGTQDIPVTIQYYNSKVQSLYKSSNIDSYIHGIVTDFLETVTQPANGSGFIFRWFDSFRFKSQQFKLSTGRSFIELPSEIYNTKACVNPINKDDDKCFEWCILFHWFYNKYKNYQQPSNIKNYHKHLSELKRPENVNFPVTEENISQYEELNNIQINVFEYRREEEGEMREKIHIVYKSEKHRKDVCNLLLVHDKEKSHYVLIRTISRLFANPKDRKSKHLCPHCFKSHRSEQLLQEHMQLCCTALSKDLHGLDTKYELPKAGTDQAILQYVDRGRKFMHPFHVIADFESTLLPCNIETKNTNEEDEEIISTLKYQHHTPNSYGLKFCSIYEEFDEDVKIYNNSNPELVKRNFIKDIEDYATKAYNIMKMNKNIIIDCDEMLHKASTECSYCNETYTKDNYKCRHHDHCTGKYIAPACRKCNLKMCLKPFLPVYIHNLKGYDAHLFISALSKYGYQNAELSCIPNNEERYITFSKKIKVDSYQKYSEIECMDVENPIFMEIRFLDTLGFMNTSLDNLCNDLASKSNNYNIMKTVFKNTAKHFKNEQDFRLMTKKGVYPYDYISSYDKLNDKELPPIEKFYSKLNDSNCSEKSYNQAKDVWKHFKCKTLLDYHNLYLKSDVLILSDIWSNFREECYNAYELDCTYYYTAPGLSFDAMLKLTKVKLELLTDKEMYDFFQDDIRGGLSNITTRYAKANNPEMKEEYNPTEETSYIWYGDMNNLYGGAMSNYLPYSGFKWNTDNWTKEDILNLQPNADIGYKFEVDLHIPEHLHDYFNNYIPCPENITINKSDLNYWQQENYRETSTSKLCTTFKDKIKYGVNYRYLQLCLRLGVELKKVHRVMQFNQKPFLKEYIDKNTEMRTKATTKFGQDFYKLMNNSVYGKCMENVKNRINFRLIATQAEAWRVKNMKHFTIFDDKLVGVHILKKCILLNKPVYLGQTVLDDSKEMMYDFHYNYMMKQFPRKDINLLFTDTDSLCYHIKTDNLDQIFAKRKDLFDFSNYDKDHPLYSTSNKKVIGKMKNESPDKQIHEFCGLRAKMYSYTKAGSNEFEQRCKGIKKRVAESTFTMERYKDVLFNRKKVNVIQRGIRTYGHELFSIEMNKVGLSFCDDKVFIHDDNIHTYNFGHKNIRPILFEKSKAMWDQYETMINQVI
jgi:hypothetical protein